MCIPPNGHTLAQELCTLPRISNGVLGEREEPSMYPKQIQIWSDVDSLQEKKKHSHFLDMTKYKILLALLSIVVLTCIAEAQGQKSFSGFSTGSSDGICKTLVETQGYTCEEHKV